MKKTKSAPSYIITRSLVNEEKVDRSIVVKKFLGIMYDIDMEIEDMDYREKVVFKLYRLLKDGEYGCGIRMFNGHRYSCWAEYDSLDHAELAMEALKEDKHDIDKEVIKTYK